MLNGLINSENLIRKPLEQGAIEKNEILDLKEICKNLVLLNTDVDNINNPREIIYYISGLAKVGEYVHEKRELSNKGFIKILLKICKNYIDCDLTKGIDKNRLYLTEEYIFIDPINESIKFMYLPGCNSSLSRTTDKLRLVLSKLIDLYCETHRMNSSTITSLKGELTTNFADLYTLVEHLNKIENSMKDNDIRRVDILHEKKSPKKSLKVNNGLAGVFLLVAAQLLTGVLSYALYNMSWDNPNVMLVSIVIIILLDLGVSFVVINYLILPSLDKKRDEVTIKENNNAEKSKHIHTSNIYNDEIKFEEYNDSQIFGKGIAFDSISHSSSSAETTFIEQVSVMGGDGDDTELISSSQNEIIAYLVSNNNGANERITVNKEEYIIGRLKQQVDYPIQNQTVGKIHAKLCYRNSDFYLIDLESKNGTFINGERVIALKEYKLSDGDEVSFSNSPYIFKC
ncbi:MAG: FHA domain-containing protein [Clostridium sp.]